MSRSEYRKLKKLIGKLEDEALNEGVDITSPEFQVIIERVITQKGFTLEEYEEAEEKYSDRAIPEGIEKIKGAKGDDGHTPTRDELLEIIRPLIPEVEDGHTPTKEELEELIKPLIPKSIKGDRGRDGKIMIALRGKQGPVGPSGKDADITTVKKELLDYIKKVDSMLASRVHSLEKNTEITSHGLKKMPDFRKLAMGLQAQIDSLGSPVTVDLDSQCDGSNQAFSIGKVKSIILVNNNGGLVGSKGWSFTGGNTLNLLDYAPSAGEELECVVIR